MDSENAAKKAEIQSKKQMKRGVLGSLAALGEEMTFAIGSGVSSGSAGIMDKYQSWDYNTSNKFFQDHFSRYLSQETLWDAAGFCRVTSSDTGVTGAVFVSTNYLSFYGYVSRTQVLQFSIPLAGVLSIQRAATLKRNTAGLPPLLQVSPNPTVDTDAILIYTSDGLVHQFHSFARKKTMENLLNILDHAWRAVQASRGTQVFVSPIARPAAMAGGPAQTPMPAPGMAAPVYAPMAAQAQPPMAAQAQAPMAAQPPVMYAPGERPVPYT
jgi:hypothetical protein